jgi:hypothetical protein
MQHQPLQLLDSPKSKFHVEASENLYQRIKIIPNTIISIQYNSNKFLAFKVNEASQGAIVREGQNPAIQCKIRGTRYTLTHEHLNQLNTRERRDLFSHLGIASTNFSK